MLRPKKTQPVEALLISLRQSLEEVKVIRGSRKFCVLQPIKTLTIR